MAVVQWDGRMFDQIIKHGITILSSTPKNVDC
jgi:hypothetical protein